jgi:hypothetical protein
MRVIIFNLELPFTKIANDYRERCRLLPFFVSGYVSRPCTLGFTNQAIITGKN